MKLLALISILIALTSAEKKCTGVYFNNQYYNVEVLKEGVNKIHQIAYSRNENTVYFIFDQIATVPTSVLGYLNLETRSSGVIGDIRNATAVTVDEETNTVYVGSSETVYRLERNDLKRLPIRDNIQSIFSKGDKLYYTNNRNEAFSFSYGNVNNLLELTGVAAEKLILDDDNNIFFTQGKRLFRVKIQTRAVNTHERYKVELIAVDSVYRPYVCTNDGIYVYNKYKYVLDKVSDMTNLRALTFNKHNEPIFAVFDLILKLKYNSTKCSESSYT